MVRPQNPGTLPRTGYYHLIRSQIDRENQLTTQRVIWLLIAEASLAVGYMTLLTVSDESMKRPLLGVQQTLLLWMLPVTGTLGRTVGLCRCAGVCEKDRGTDPVVRGV